jgi:predicted 3-demethylubiquinone-9 3-methyltransferase (glyoxalase superfamily)
MSDVISHLWYADKAEEAVAFYVSLLSDSRIDSMAALPADVLAEMMKDPDRARAKRVTEAMLGMIKLDIAGLQKAYDAR